MDEPVSPCKRMQRREIPRGVHFVTFSCTGRLPLLGNPRIRDQFTARLARARTGHRFELFAWVVMPEHVHLLMRPHPEVPVSRVLHSLKFAFAKQVLDRWRELDAPVMPTLCADGREPRFWQRGGGFDRNVRDAAEFTKEIGYIHRNPVKRGLVERPEDWRWSSIL